jgi:tRNA U34 2-thiouridine synthase MnmA/TrmU
MLQSETGNPPEGWESERQIKNLKSEILKWSQQVIHEISGLAHYTVACRKGASRPISEWSESVFGALI